ncbi:MAG TPA: gamma carbonic anhydrase family protein, partial [Streptomyces sp.]|nr:gamma carbonic anhydrase family protein [Streptomyces sp.]
MAKQRPVIAGVSGKEPKIDEEAYAAPTSVVVGDVTLGAASSVWYGAVLRADCDMITLGSGSNIQD